MGHSGLTYSPRSVSLDCELLQLEARHFVLRVPGIPVFARGPPGNGVYRHQVLVADPFSRDGGSLQLF